MGSKVSIMATDANNIAKSSSSIHENRLAEFTRLKGASFGRNSLTEVPPTISRQIASLPPLIDTLIELDLSNGSLTSLPDEIGLLVNLKKLRLENNRLASLPDNFPALYKLDKLYLNDNKLTSLPVGMANMQLIKTLHLHKNGLTWIPNDIGKLPNLEELTIHENPLTESAVYDLDDLGKVLAYFRNQTVPTAYRKLTKDFRAKVKAKDCLNELRGGLVYAFRIMLTDVPSQNRFLEFLNKEYAGENLRFYLEVEQFRNQFSSDFPIVSRELLANAKKLYMKYIDDAESNRLAINIPINIKKKIDSAFELDGEYYVPPNINQWVFSEASASILKLMLDDPLKRFRASREGKAVWAPVEQYEKDEELAKNHPALKENLIKKRKNRLLSL